MNYLKFLIAMNVSFLFGFYQKATVFQFKGGKLEVSTLKSVFRRFFLWEIETFFYFVVCKKKPHDF